MKKIIELSLFSFVAFTFLFGSVGVAHASYFNSYFDRVMPNLEDVYQQHTTLGAEIEEEISYFKGDTTVAEDMLTMARTKLTLAKKAMNEARMAYDNESTPTPPPFALFVTNENGVILATSEAGYRMCVLYQGTTNIQQPNRCSIGNVVFINPSLQENAAMLVYADHTNHMPFPLTNQYVKETRTFLKDAQKYLAQAHAIINEPKRGGSPKRSESQPTPDFETIIVTSESLAPLE